MKILQWGKKRANPTAPTARCFLSVGSDYGPYNDTATPADIIACLDANQDVAAEVWRYLTESQGLKDTLTSERDEAHRQLTETWNVIGGPPEHPEEDPEVSTLPAAVRVRLAELEVRFADALPQGDPYRKKILPMLEPARRPVYCVDCRFKKIGVNNDAICLAQPTKGKYLIIGQGQTNADHDCAHFQKREPS